jgi:two-component system phosphate regulon response regulator PhoB
MLFPKGRILCTEDDPDTRDLLSYVLSDAGYEVICTDDANGAMALARQQTIDLILVDSWLPDRSGTELTRSLRKMDVKTPILFYSGAGHDSDKEAAFSAGAQAYLVKPVLNEDLINAVSRLIAESQIAVTSH